MDKESFVYVIYIATTPEKVWQALLDGELTRQYWQHEQLSDWKPGSPWQLIANDGKGTVRHVGEVLETIPNTRLMMTWADPAEGADKTKHTRVAIDIVKVGEMVRLTVTHTDLGPDMQRKITYGWPIVLSSLKSFLETGRTFEIWNCIAS